MLEMFADLANVLSLISTAGIIVLTVRAFQNARLLNEQTEILQRLEDKAAQQDKLLAVALKADVDNLAAIRRG